jgi:hypothetical protein
MEREREEKRVPASVSSETCAQIKYSASTCGGSDERKGSKER